MAEIDQVGKNSANSLSIDVTVSHRLIEETPFIRTETVFPFVNQKTVPPRELASGNEAAEAYGMCGFANLEDKQKCNKAFKLYEDALKSADGVDKTAPDRASLGADSADIAAVRTHAEEFTAAAEANNKLRIAAVVSYKVKIDSPEDAKMLQHRDYLLDQKANLSGIRYSYALSLSAYSRAFHDDDAMEKAKNVINQAAVIDPSSRYHFEIEGAQARINRGTWVDPSATKAEGMVIEASNVLDFPHFFSAIPELSRKTAINLIADAKINNYEATREELRFREPFWGWDSNAWWSIERASTERVTEKLKRR